MLRTATGILPGSQDYRIPAEGPPGFLPFSWLLQGAYMKLYEMAAHQLNQPLYARKVLPGRLPNPFSGGRGVDGRIHAYITLTPEMALEQGPPRTCGFK